MKFLMFTLVAFAAIAFAAPLASAHEIITSTTPSPTGPSTA